MEAADEGDPGAALERVLTWLYDHRAARQKESPALTLTDAYNVLAQLRAGATLTPEDEKVRGMALTATRFDIHEQLDRAVADAYGWPHGLPDDEVLTRLVILNATRAAEEAKGLVRWLRSDLQAPQSAQTDLALEGPKSGGTKAPRKAAKAAVKLPWPAGLPGRIEALVTFLRAQGVPMTAAALAEEGTGAAFDDMLLTLQCAAAAQAVTRLEDDEGHEVWAARA